MADSSPATPPALATPSPLPTRVEPVPGYLPRGLAESGHENISAASHRGTPVRDAAMGAFRSVDTMEVVIGDDDRTVVPEVTRAPWRHICALRITTKTNKPYVGTGWFIGPRTVMTAGHCVYMHDEGGWARSIEVIPALSGEDRPFGSTASLRFQAVDGWVDERNSDYDYGAILLDRPVGNATGWYAFAAPDPEVLRSAEANICGYPLDRSRATRQYFHARRVTRASRRRIYYEIDTYGGQSGSPMWLNVDGKRVAVGIHTTGSSTSNSGTLINKEVFDNMRLWKY